MQQERHTAYMKRRSMQLDKYNEIMDRLPHTDKKVVVTHS